MIKIDFNTVVPYPQRNNLIHSLQNLGFKMEYLYRTSDTDIHSLIRFRGRFPPVCDLSEPISIIFENDELRDIFKNIFNDNVELFFHFERKIDYENKL